jgi:hemerythrin-like domain-containing protein
MNSIVDILEAEHRSIESGLAALEQSLRPQPDWPLLSQILHFVRGYADQFHHAKEEDLLFPRLVERGLPGDSGPIGCMLDEHEEGREYVRSMLAAIEKQDAGRLQSAGRAYVALLRQHIAKEDGILFPMARRLLGEADEKELLQRAMQLAQRSSDAESLRLSLPELLGRAFSATNS